MPAHEAVSSLWFNLEKASILLLDADPMNRVIMGQILLGFGARNIERCTSVTDAKDCARRIPFDLIIVDPMVDKGAGYDFVSWLRRKGEGDNRFAPVLMVTGHTQQSRIGQARDCGANFVVAKPLSPATIYERIVWMAREKRPYVESDIYAGPERRFKEDAASAAEGRRRDDAEEDAAVAASADVGADGTESGQER